MRDMAKSEVVQVADSLYVQVTDRDVSLMDDEYCMSFTDVELVKVIAALSAALAERMAE